MLAASMRDVQGNCPVTACRKRLWMRQRGKAQAHLRLSCNWWCWLPCCTRAGADLGRAETHSVREFLRCALDPRHSAL